MSAEIRLSMVMPGLRVSQPKPRRGTNPRRRWSSCAERRRQAEGLRLAIEIAQQCPGNPRDPPLGVHADRPQAGLIDDRPPSATELPAMWCGRRRVR
jgi:hypothetical protein